MELFSKTSIAMAATIGTCGFFLVGAGAQEASHDGHHPPEATVQAPQGDTPDTPTMGGGKMGGDHMSKMMKDMHGKMMGNGMSMMPKGDTGPSSIAFNGIMMKMHQNMELTYTGNADLDFIKGMIPHHQGAVDMANTVLAFGKDADVKAFAEGVIKAQDAEIAWMQDWLKKQGQ